MYIVVLPKYSPRSLSKAHDAKSVENTDTKSSVTTASKKKKENWKKTFQLQWRNFKEKKSEQTIK